ncbi:alpha/beta fold hydrolase [Psychrosphaera haliotis]|nr:alpha/beta fold hydrolase [Psychrosphaera haliotis]
MTINYQSMGEGKPLIIIHGLFGTSDNLKAVARELSDEHKVYLIDAPGHGDSDTVVPLSIANMANAVSDFIKQLNVGPVQILGHSLGGKIAMEIALANPELISKLIVADIAPVQYKPRHDDIISSLQAVPLSTLENRKDADEILARKINEPGVRSFLLKSLVRDKSKPGEWMWRFNLDQLSSDYNELIKSNREGTYSGSTLFIIGSESSYVLPEHRGEIVGRFPNTKAKTINGAGHWLHAERSVAFVKICRDFLSE